MGNQLVKKYEEVIQSVQESTGIKIVSVEEIADNEVFIRLKDSFKPYFSDFSEFGDRLTLVIDKILTVVELKNGGKLKVHNYLFFELPDGSHLRISPFGSDQIEVSRIWVHPNHINQGLGSEMMNLLLEFIRDTLGFVPPLFLECTGSVGLGENNQESPISKQTAFFRKFGFRVKDGKSYPSYVSMMRPKEESQPKELIEFVAMSNE